MATRPSALLLLLALPLLGCSRDGKDTFEDMKKSACAGDVQAFFAHVDKTQLGKSLAQTTAQQAAKAVRGDPSADIGPEAERMISAAVQAAFTAWEDDIKKGEAGDLCKMRLTSVDERGDTAAVTWTSARGSENVWRLKRYDKTWLLIEMSGDEARLPAVPIERETPPASPPEPPAPPDWKSECNALIKAINAEGAKLSAKGDPSDPLAVTRLADSLDAAAYSIATVRLTIPELIKYRDISSKLFQSSAGIARMTATSLQKKDGAGVNAGIKAMGESADLNAKAMRGITKLCQPQP